MNSSKEMKLVFFLDAIQHVSRFVHKYMYKCFNGIDNETQLTCTCSSLIIVLFMCYNVQCTVCLYSLPTSLV